MWCSKLTFHSLNFGGFGAGIIISVSHGLIGGFGNILIPIMLGSSLSSFRNYSRLRYRKLFNDRHSFPHSIHYYYHYYYDWMRDLFIFILDIHSWIRDDIREALFNWTTKFPQSFIFPWWGEMLCSHDQYSLLISLFIIFISIKFLIHHHHYPFPTSIELIIELSAHWSCVVISSPILE